MTNFGTNDDRRRLYGDELGIESNKYRDAIIELRNFDDDIFRCIMDKVLDFGNHKRPSDEGIEKGELHKRDRIRFASGIFEAFFDKKIIDEKTYDRLFKNLREHILMDYLGCHQEQERQREEWIKLRKQKERLLDELLDRGVKLRSGRILS